MNTLQIFTLVLFGIEFVGIVVSLLCSHILYKFLEKKHPKYYKFIGQPKVHGYTEYAPTASDLKRQLKGITFVLLLTRKGIPAGFPKEQELQKLANFLRYIYLGTAVIFPVLAALFLYFAHLGIAP